MGGCKTGAGVAGTYLSMRDMDEARWSPKGQRRIQRPGQAMEDLCPAAVSSFDASSGQVDLDQDDHAKPLAHRSVPPTPRLSLSSVSHGRSAPCTLWFRNPASGVSGWRNANKQRLKSSCIYAPILQSMASSLSPISLSLAVIIAISPPEAPQKHHCLRSIPPTSPGGDTLHC